MPSMTITTVFICAVVLMLTASMPVQVGYIFENIRVSGSTIFWRNLLRDREAKNYIVNFTVYDALTDAFMQDFNALVNGTCTTKSYFAVINRYIDGTYFSFNNYGDCNIPKLLPSLDGTKLSRLSEEVRRFVSTAGPDVTAFAPSGPIVIQTHFLPSGSLPPPLPPGVIANTTNKQTVMLSGDDTLWSKLVANAAPVRAVIEFDFASALSRSGVAVNCTVDSLAPHRADPTKMLPGDGNSGLTVNVTITQDILYETSNHPYDMHAMSAVLMSASMTNTSALYNDDHDGQTAPVKVVAAYEDMVYSPLDCTYTCIVALTLLVSVVYLMAIVAIVTVIATQCYLIKDFDFTDLTTEDLQMFPQYYNDVKAGVVPFWSRVWDMGRKIGSAVKSGVSTIVMKAKSLIRKHDAAS